MAYREKIAWLSLVGMALAFGSYFAWTAVTRPDVADMPNLPLMAVYAAAAGVYAVVSLGGYLALRREAARPDERDLLIDGRATRVAYYVLMGLMLYVGGYKPFVAQGGWEIVNDTIASVVIAEVVRSILTVVGYRRSAG